MADIHKIVSFIIRFEAGAAASGLDNEALFERARRTAWADDPDDAGGQTMCGVTLGTYKAYCRRKGWPAPTAERLRSIPYAQWLDVLRTLYWDRWHADEIDNQSVALMLVDWVWASGADGIRIPQRVLGVAQDGIAGPRTMTALHQAVRLNPRMLFDSLHRARRQYIDNIIARRPANAKFRDGWLRRLDAIKYSPV